MLQTAVILALIANNTLYISNPPGTQYAFITYDYHAIKSITWFKMKNSTLGNGLPVYKINLKSDTQGNCLRYKIHYISNKNDSMGSDWQTINSYSASEVVSQEYIFWVVFIQTLLIFMLYLGVYYNMIRFLKNTFSG